MAHSSAKSLPEFPAFPQSKTLIAEHPGKVAVLLEDGKTSVKKFTGAAAALKWCEVHRIAFYYLPTASVAAN